MCLVMHSNGQWRVWWYLVEREDSYERKTSCWCLALTIFRDKNTKYNIYYDNKEATLPRAQPHIQNLRRKPNISSRSTKISTQNTFKSTVEALLCTGFLILFSIFFILISFVIYDVGKTTLLFPIESDLGFSVQLFITSKMVQ